MKFKDILLGLNTENANFSERTIEDVNNLSGARKKRKIFVQSKVMKLIHKRIMGYIRERAEFPNATGSVPGSSVAKHLSFHMRDGHNGDRRFNRFLYPVDIKDAYKSVSLEKMADALVALEMDVPRQLDIETEIRKEEITSFLKRFCFSEKRGLVVGATASPDLFNLFMEHFVDRKIRRVLAQYELSYSRYLDDLLFSSHVGIGKVKKKVLRGIVRQAGLNINIEKTDYYDLKKGSVVINGIGINLDGRMYIPRHHLFETKGLLFMAVKKGVKVDPRVIMGRVALIKHLLRTNKQRANRTESKVLSLYEIFKHNHKAQSCSPKQLKLNWWNTDGYPVYLSGF